MKYHFEFRPYQRKFKQPLKTSHGSWKIREGIILQLTDKAGHIGFGEIAPLSWFGSESFEQALDWCRQLPSEITTDDVFAIPSELPASQFGFESAWEAVFFSQFEESKEIVQSNKQITFSGLLPSGQAALNEWKILWNKGYRTFKWKVGIAPIQEEIKIFYNLVKQLPSEAKFRLDANGGLSFVEAEEWLSVCDRIGIEFFEQPLPADQFNEILSLSKRDLTLLALDESVANLYQLKECYEQGWRGVFVIKPAIAGSPKLLRQFCQNYEIDAVFSSVFETSIGRQAGLRLAAELSKNCRAAGFGVNNWFIKTDFLSEPEATLFEIGDYNKVTPQDIWKYL
ncbi:MAG: o-succinylbenzoate synthase [Microcoleus sp. SIO2G3]|nr:o-succinylbenzoate synthase [Microcoleus sp. SIO2G3]